MNDREKKLVQFTAIGLAVYLILFFGKDYFGILEKKRTDFIQMEKAITSAQVKLRKSANQPLLLEQSRKKLNLEVRSLSSAELVGKTSQAIQQTAKSSGIKIGPLRESSSIGISSLKFEANGKAESMLKFLRGIRSCGYPVVIDSMQVTVPEGKKGNVSFNLAIGIIDFKNWKKPGAPSNG